MSQSESIHIAADLSFLHTDYLWRMPGSWIGYPYYGTSEFYEDIARLAERGVMDMLFFGMCAVLFQRCRRRSGGRLSSKRAYPGPE